MKKKKKKRREILLNQVKLNQGALRKEIATPDLIKIKSHHQTHLQLIVQRLKCDHCHIIGQRQET
jgi:hypothetical protein